MMARALFSLKAALALTAVALCVAASLASPSDSKDSKKRHKWERLGLWGKRSAIAPLAGTEHEVLLSAGHAIGSHQPASVGVYEIDSEDQQERFGQQEKRRAGAKNEWSRLGLIGRK